MEEKDKKETPAETTPANGKTTAGKGRKRLIKWSSIILIVILLLIFLPGIIVNYVVPPVASKVLKVKVEIGSAFINIFDGAVRIRNVKIHNPSGYDTPYAFELGHFFVDVDVFSLTSPKIIIEDVILEGMHATMEMKWDTNNFKEIGNSLKKAETAETEDTPEEKVEEAPAEKKEPKKMVIRHLYIRDCDFTMLKVPLMLPPIEMNDIGDGRPVGEFFIVLYDAVIEAVVTAAKNVSDGILDLGKNIGDGTKNAGESIGKSLQDASNSIKDAGKSLEEAGKSLKSLFK